MSESEPSEKIHAPKLGEPGEQCTQCSAPLAEDQRYCLNCGSRRAQARLPFMETLSDSRTRPGLIGGLGGQPLTVSVAAIVVLALGVGFLIGSLTLGEDSRPVVAASKPQIITVKIPNAAPAIPTVPVEEPFQSDWPAGQKGYTVQLRTLPVDGTQTSAVDAAKSEATTQGADDVGALNSDDFASLDPGNYVIYSGVFKSKKKAKKALKKLRKDFLEAELIKISTSDNASIEDYSKRSKTLPEETQIPGKAPPKDDKEAGGGSDSTSIG